MKYCRVCWHKETGQDLMELYKEKHNCDKCGRLRPIVKEKICPKCNDTKLIKEQREDIDYWLAIPTLGISLIRRKINCHNCNKN